MNSPHSLALFVSHPVSNLLWSMSIISLTFKVGPLWCQSVDCRVLPMPLQAPKLSCGLAILLNPTRPRAEATCLLSSVPKSKDCGILSESPAWMFLLMAHRLGVGRLMLPGFLEDLGTESGLASDVCEGWLQAAGGGDRGQSGSPADVGKLASGLPSFCSGREWRGCWHLVRAAGLPPPDR